MDLSFYKGKKVLVTGHTGFKGSWLCRILVKAGAEVTGYSLVPPTTPNLFSMADIENNINSVIGDIRDLEHLKKVFAETQPEILIIGVFRLWVRPPIICPKKAMRSCSIILL